MKPFFFALGFVLAAAPAFAQQAPTTKVDPRIANEVIQTLQAELALTNKIAETIKQDAMKREQDWVEYSKPLWDFKPKEKK